MLQIFNLFRSGLFNKTTLLLGIIASLLYGIYFGFNKITTVIVDKDVIIQNKVKRIKKLEDSLSTSRFNNASCLKTLAAFEQVAKQNKKQEELRRESTKIPKEEIYIENNTTKFTLTI